MSGHSKWATIKRAKGAKDAARGKLFGRIIKEITIAARNGGDPDGNPRLRLAVDKAKGANMPADNIKRAIQRGTGEMEGVNYEENTYEGYGPSGVAFLVETITDNKNRTVAELRHLFSKNGGSLAESGSVAWKFSRKGVIAIPKKYGEDDLMMIALEAGAEDMTIEEESFEIVTDPASFDTVVKALEEQEIEIQESEIQMVPQNTVKVDGKDAEGVLRLLEVLEDHDDVQNVYADFDIDADVMSSLE
ncbi:MAG: YebC/PmpR family DNA-binding transcriptional regulator [Bacteroidota bacterium]|jgi:YebC/PmpR family DNA-binding regulatory protein|nr:YebC/PmpR family DNA-binding transcriptional regulator [Bacteroidota bacterium]